MKKKILKKWDGGVNTAPRENYFAYDDSSTTNATNIMKIHVCISAGYTPLRISYDTSEL